MTSIAAEPWFQAPQLRRIFDLLNADGGEVRIVGGAIRNSLMGLPAGDVDLATTWHPEDVIQRARGAGIKSVPTGIDHGTVTLVIEGMPYEVTTLRRDVATDGRRAEVAFRADWKADAQRRDFTINALYGNAEGEVLDHVGGLDDIATRTVRFIGSAAERVAEDYLRILRFFRFFAHYGSGRPDAEGLKACAQARTKLATLSAERVWTETKKLLSAVDPGRALLWMRQAGVLGEVLPETEKWGIDAIPALISAEKSFSWHPDHLLRLAAMVPPDVDRLEAMAKRLRLSKAESAYLDRFAKAPAIAPGTCGCGARSPTLSPWLRGHHRPAEAGACCCAPEGRDRSRNASRERFLSAAPCAGGQMAAARISVERGRCARSGDTRRSESGRSAGRTRKFVDRAQLQRRTGQTRRPT
ncbi:poly(A) polymerase [Sinorhizobium medicae]